MLFQLTLNSIPQCIAHAAFHAANPWNFEAASWSRLVSGMAAKPLDAQKEGTACSVKVNYRLIPSKLYYVAFFAGWACLLPFLTVYYRYLGMSARQAGIIQSAGQFITLTGPTFGLLGDKLRNPKLIWILSLLGQTLFAMLFGLAIKPNSNIRQMEVYCNCNGSNLSLINMNTNSTKSSDCASFQLWEGEWVKFAELLSLVLAMQVMLGPTSSIADAFVLTILGDDHRGDYGKQRAWGAAAWGVSAVGIGFLTDSISECGDINYNIHYYVFGGMLVLSTVFALFVRAEGELCRHELKLMHSLCALLSQPDVVIFLFGMVVSGAVMTIVDNFLFWFLQDIGGGQSVMGLSLLAMCTGEVIIFIPSGWMIKTLGHHGAVTLSLFVYMIRFIAYSFLTDPWYVLLIEPLHGFTFGLCAAACVSYMRVVTTVDMQAGAQTIGYAVRNGLGKGIGNAVAGVVWHHYGAVLTFRGAAVVSAVGGGLFWIMHLLLVYGLCVDVPKMEQPPDERTGLLNVDRSTTSE